MKYFICKFWWRNRQGSVDFKSYDYCLIPNINIRFERGGRHKGQSQFRLEKISEGLLVPLRKNREREGRSSFHTDTFKSFRNILKRRVGKMVSDETKLVEDRKWPRQFVTSSDTSLPRVRTYGLNFFFQCFLVSLVFKRVSGNFGRCFLWRRSCRRVVDGQVWIWP